MLLLLLPATMAMVRAQLSGDMFRTEADTPVVGRVMAGVEYAGFFVNHEYQAGIVKGYTLPGVRLRPYAAYEPLPGVRLEAGVDALRYWGAERYPNYAYRDIAEWKANGYQRGAHLLPFVRVRAALSAHTALVVGSLYGGADHRLAEPLYAPELNLTADPEAGLQLLHRSGWVDADVWVDWQSFIFRNDTHREAFVFGLSSRLKYDAIPGRLRLYLPVQAVAQHRGGEIDTIYTASVQTLMNFAVGLGAEWQPGGGMVKRLNGEVWRMGYWQQAGQLWPFGRGGGVYARLMADAGRVRLKGSYWACRDFISILGSPFFGAVSTAEPGTTFRSPRMLTAGIEYLHRFGRGYTLGVAVEAYHHLPTDRRLPDGGTERRGAATSISAGVCFRACPTWRLR